MAYLRTLGYETAPGSFVIGDITKYPGGFPGGANDLQPTLSTCVEAGIVGAPAKTPITALVECKSTLGGFVLPRMTAAQRNAMAAGTVADGTQVYVTDLLNVYTRINNAWVAMGVATGEIFGPGVTNVNALTRWSNITGTALDQSPALTSLSNAGDLTAVHTIQNGAGTVLLPSYTFTGTVTTGMWSAGATTVNFSTANGQQLSLLDPGVATANSWRISGSGAGTALNIGVAAASTDANVALNFNSKGNLGFNFLSGNGTAFTIAGSAAATVNHLQVAGSITGNAVVLSSQGTDPNVDITVLALGTGGINLNSGGVANYPMLFVKNTGGILVNYLEVAPSTTGAPVVITATGTDANIALELSSSGNFPVFIDGNFALGSSFAAADTNTMLIVNGTAPTANAVANSIKLYSQTAVAAGPINARTLGIWADVSPVSVVAPTAPDRTLAIVVNGTTYYLAAKTTND